MLPTNFQYQAKTEGFSKTIEPGKTYESPWHQPWSEPVRQKILPALAVALIASGLFSPVLTPNIEPGKTYESPWHQAWSEPVRVKPRLLEGLQQSYTSGFFAKIEPGSTNAAPWLYPWSEPVRIKPHFPIGTEPFLAWDARPPIVSFAYYNWLTEPVRQKPGLGAQLQQFISLATPVEPSPKVELEGWYNWFSEPTRSLAGLQARYQQALAQPPRLLPTPQVTGILNAADSKDIAEFSVVLYGKPVSARVSIVQIPAIRGGNISLVQMPGIPIPPPPVTPLNAYVAEDGVTYYVAEDGTTYYVQET
jgi:hypothetical protein